MGLINVLSGCLNLRQALKMEKPEVGDALTDLRMEKGQSIKDKKIVFFVSFHEIIIC